MGQARNRGSKEQRIAQSKERAEELKKELDILQIEEDNMTMYKEEVLKQLIQWHLDNPPLTETTINI